MLGDFSGAAHAAAAALGLLLQPAGRAAAEEFGPFATKWHPAVKSRTPPPPAAPGGGGVAAAAHPFRGAYEFYRLVLTDVDGPRCAHRPSCSLYGWQAVRRHGVVLGTWLALDRLLRADRSSRLRPLPTVRIGGVEYLLDPLDASDFWLPREAP